MGDDVQAAATQASAVLERFPARFLEHHRRGMEAKLGLTAGTGADEEIVNDLLRIMHREQADYTATFRTLAGHLRGGIIDAAYADWADRWKRLSPDADAMDRVNPVYIPRNHLVEDALTDATVGDLDAFHRLLDAVTRPFDERPGLEAHAQPAPSGFDEHYRTFCGT